MPSSPGGSWSRPGGFAERSGAPEPADAAAAPPAHEVAGPPVEVAGDRAGRGRRRGGVAAAGAEAESRLEAERAVQAGLDQLMVGRTTIMIAQATYSATTNLPSGSSLSNP